MSVATDFERVAGESATTRLRGSWLVSMLVGQGQNLQWVAELLARPGLEHMNRSLTQAALLHECVAREVPLLRGEKVVGTANAKLLVGWALTTGLIRTQPDIDGILATGLRCIAASRILVRLIHDQQQFGADMMMAVDQAAALGSALDRAEAEIRQFESSALGPVPQ